MSRRARARAEATARKRLSFEPLRDEEAPDQGDDLDEAPDGWPAWIDEPHAQDLPPQGH